MSTNDTAETTDLRVLQPVPDELNLLNGQSAGACCGGVCGCGE